MQNIFVNIYMITIRGQKTYKTRLAVTKTWQCTLDPPINYFPATALVEGFIEQLGAR